MKNSSISWFGSYWVLVNYLLSLSLSVSLFYFLCLSLFSLNIYVYSCEL